MRNLILVAGCISLFLTACNQSPKAGDSIHAGLNLDAIDKSVKPEDDFWKHVNGTWLKNTEIPSDKSYIGTGILIHDRNQEILRECLEEAMNKNLHEKGSDEYKAVAFFQVGMDEAAVEANGLKDLEPLMAIVDGIKDLASLQEALISLKKAGFGGFFSTHVDRDQRNSSVNAVSFSQSGLSLPDRDYYVKIDPRSEELRSDFVSHVGKMMELMGESKDKAASTAKTIMALETRMANAFMTRLEKRDPQKTYNKMAISDLEKAMPAIKWSAYFQEIGFEGLDSVIVDDPSYLTELNNILANETKADNWKPYLKWRVLNAMADYLPKAFEEESFAFYDTKLRGSQEMQPRWRRVLSATNSFVGMPLGKLYISKAFPPEAKADMMFLVEKVKQALETRIKNLSWMTEATKQEALKKLSTIGTKIGYPDVWEDFSKLEIGNKSYAANVLSAKAFRVQKNIAKYGEAPDPNDWHLTPQTLNAYYSPTQNEIVFPAGILQPPFYDYEADPALKYGGCSHHHRA